MHITLMVWYLQLCISSAHFLVDPYGFWVTGFVSGRQPIPSKYLAVLDRQSKVLTVSLRIDQLTRN